jgi:hypothetical protein
MVWQARVATMPARKRRDLPTRSPADRHGTASQTGMASRSSCRTKPQLEPIEANQRTGQQHEREEPSRVPIPPHCQPPIAAQPRQRVGSGRGAVPPFRVVRFPGPHLRTGRASSPASGSPQARAGGLLLIIIRSPSMALGSARPGSGSGSPSRARSAAAPLCRGSATTLVGSGGAATPNSLVGACGAAIAGPGSR